MAEYEDKAEVCCQGSQVRRVSDQPVRSGCHDTVLFDEPYPPRVQPSESPPYSSKTVIETRERKGQWQVKKTAGKS